MHSYPHRMINTPRFIWVQANNEVWNMQINAVVLNTFYKGHVKDRGEWLSNDRRHIINIHM